MGHFFVEICLKWVLFCDIIVKRKKGFYMKKVCSIATLFVFIALPAMAAGTGMDQALCKLASEFGKIFNILRILMFAGAGWTIATWAWGFISAPKAIDPVAQAKEKLIPMLVGFALLFGIGTILSIFMSMAGPGGSLGCIENFFK